MSGPPSPLLATARPYWHARSLVRRAAGELLRPGGLLFIYGPFKLNGEHTSEGNAAFDASLRQRNPGWGYRDVGEVAALAEAAGLAHEATVHMPANNFSLAFRKRGGAP